MAEVLVNIDVSDIEAARAFYCSAFGLAPARRLGAGALELVGANCRIYLLANAEGTRASHASDARRSYDRHWTPVHLDFVVAALEPAIACSLAAGATQEGDVRDNSWGRIVTMADPFGHGYCLIEFSEAGYDAIST
jgi:catechol 2,3-dioxygenase-like lactoylglutathione lyase family enzyme